MIDYNLILKIKYPNIRYAITDNDYKTIIWDNKIIYKPTKEELDSQWEEVLSIKKREECKIQARQLLADSDWSETPSVIEQLENANEWKTYRMEVRKFVICPVENPEFPSKPQTKWKV